MKQVYQEDILNPVDFEFNPVHEIDLIARVHVKNIGDITVLYEVTGYSGGVRDIETGFRGQCKEEYKLISKDGEAKRYADFWLASGMFDIRSFKGTYGDAIKHIKSCANTCIGELADIV